LENFTMAVPSGGEQAEESVVVQLIDSARGQLLQVWCFTGQESISIGRAPECDVVVFDPYVSRRHAEFQLRGGQWWLVGLGRHGVVVQNQSIEETLAYDGMQFRLGTDGPVLRFVESSDGAAMNGATLCLDASAKIVLRIDEARLSNEVRAITEGDYFQQLKAKARDLRQNRVGPPA
jgi:pSer/pThr/pTyr-binding forkhead associated (FHA) protein